MHPGGGDCYSKGIQNSLSSFLCPHQIKIRCFLFYVLHQWQAAGTNNRTEGDAEADAADTALVRGYPGAMLLPCGMYRAGNNRWCEGPHRSKASLHPAWCSAAQEPLVCRLMGGLTGRA